MDYGFNYNEALEGLSQLLTKFDDEEILAAMEAANTLTQTAKKSNATDQSNNKLDDQNAGSTTDGPSSHNEIIRKIHDDVLASLNKVAEITNRTMDTVISTNQAFVDSVEKGNFNVADSVEVFNWTYGHDPAQYLHPKLAKFHAVIAKEINYLHTWENISADSVIARNGNAVEEATLQAIGAAASIDRFRQYVTFTQTQFRGKKSKVDIPGSAAQNMMNTIKTFGQFKQRFSKDVNQVKQVMVTAASIANAQVSSSQLTDQDKQKFMKLYRNSAKMAIIYINLIQFIYQIHMEYVLNRRAILKRLYQK